MKTLYLAVIIAAMAAAGILYGWPLAVILFVIWLFDNLSNGATIEEILRENNLKV